MASKNCVAQKPIYIDVFHSHLVHLASCTNCLATNPDPTHKHIFFLNEEAILLVYALPEAFHSQECV